MRRGRSNSADANLNVTAMLTLAERSPAVTGL
jgi:hypothetical protein